jgi:lipid II:glycine glycyltransferase (peptidoglycan interpeptide bridge formation enzyme)
MTTLELMPDYVAEIENVGWNRWMEILQEFDDAVIYQTWPYGAIRWGEDKLSHLILSRGSEIVAMAQCTVRRVPGLGAGIAYVPWGPIWRLHGKERDPVVFQQMLRTLQREYVERRGLLLRIAPNEMDDTISPLISILEEEGFQLDATIAPYRTFLLDLSYSLEEVRKGFKRQWRQNLNHAEHNGLKIIQGTADELYQTFLDLYQQMLNRKDFDPGVDVHEFGQIQKGLPNAFKMNIMICESEKKPVAALVVSSLGNSAIALHAATAEKGLDLKAAYFLQWRMIEWLKSMGICWYDLGGIDPEKNPGGYQYKSGLSGKCGREVRHVGQYKVSCSFRSSIVVGLGSKLQRTYRRARGLA